MKTFIAQFKQLCEDVKMSDAEIIELRSYFNNKLTREESNMQKDMLDMYSEVTSWQDQTWSIPMPRYKKTVRWFGDTAKTIVANL